MKLTKLFLALTLTLITGVTFATTLRDVRDAKVSDMAAVVSTWTNELGTATVMDKIEYSAAQGLVYLRSNENATFAEARSKVMAKAKELGIEKEMAASSYMYGIVHPWWVGETRPALLQETLAYAEANPPADGAGAYAEIGRIYAFVLKDYVKGLAAFQKGNFQSDTLRCYMEIGDTANAVKYYYELAESGKISAGAAAEYFPTVWAAQAKGFKTAEERDAAKFRLSKLVDQYTSKLYSDANVKPENSPWRKVITLWTASSK